jgi:hypothetical protein
MDLLIYKKMGKIEKLLSKLYKKKDLMMELEKKKIIMALELEKLPKEQDLKEYKKN